MRNLRIFLLYFLCTGVFAYAKPCPMVLGLDAAGHLRSTRSGTWGPLTEKTLRMDLAAPSACYPEDGPSPISAVTLELLPSAAPPRIDWLMKILAEYGWTKARVTIQKVQKLH